MNTKKIIKILTAVVIAIMVLTICVNVFAATDPSALKAKIENQTSFDALGGKIIGMIQAIGNIVAIAILVVLGIKYMMGSAEEKAEYKKTMIPYLVGAVLVFAGANIAQFVYSFANGI